MKNGSAADCVLCQPPEADVVYASQHWRVLVNRNQNKLGKCMICLRRHDEDVCNLSNREVRELWAVIRRVKAALTSCFQPDHFNYSFLMNQDAHVHLHVIPRYQGPRVFAGFEFWEKGSNVDLRLPLPSHEQVIATLREALSRTST